MWIWASLLYFPQAAAEVQLSFTTETVGDTATYSPNLPDGGFATAREFSRYSGRRVAIEWKTTKRLTLETELSQFEFVSLRDRFNTTGFSLLARQTLENSTPQNTTTLEFRVASNYADAINKNSYTNAGDNVITGLTVNRPGDLTVQAGFNHQTELTSTSNWRIYSSIGHLRTRHSGVYGTATNGNCKYDFNFGNNGGQITQAIPCGDVFSFSRQYPDDNSLEQDLGISPTKDITYSATMFKAGGGFSIRRNLWLLNVNAYFQQYFRSAIDQRINESGNTSYDSNRVFSTELIHQTTSRLSFSAKVEYNRRQFLNHTPFLYNSFTAGGFGNDAIFFAFETRYYLL